MQSLSSTWARLSATLLFCTSLARAAQVEDPESRGVEIAKLLHAGTWGLFHNESEPGRYPTFASINYNNETFSGEDKEMSSSPSRTPKIFLIGDSVDRQMMKATGCLPQDYFPRGKASNCSQTASEAEVPHYAKARKDSFVADCPGKMITNLFIRGIMSGHHQDSVCEPGLPAGFNQSIETASQAFISRHGHPDLVLLKSFYWDVMITCRRYGCSPPHTINATTLAAELLDYEHQLRTAIAIVKQAFPRSIVALRTDPMWNPRTVRFGDAATVHSIGLGLLRAVRQVASTDKLVLFDLFEIFHSLDPDTYLADDIHLNEYFSRLVLGLLSFFLEKLFPL